MSVAAAGGGAASGVVTASSGYPVLAAASAAIAGLVVIVTWQVRAVRPAVKGVTADTSGVLSPPVRRGEQP
jgi:hypothetical protein